MKIVCENCGAKYSIADEKVKGKVFKIRCKKCSESILVRGDTEQSAPEPAQPAPAAAPEPGEEMEAETRVFDYAGYNQGGEDEAMWHIVVDDQQQGPYTAGQIKEYLQGGSLTSESLIWREGFEDWMVITDVPEFADARPAATGGGLFDDQPGNKLFDEQPAGGGLFGAQEESGSPFDSGGGLFSGNADTTGNDVFSSAAPEQPAAGLFGDTGGNSALFGGKEEESTDEGIFSSTRDNAVVAADPRVSAEQAMMTGQRNENSVLFSLSNLQALAAGPAAETAAAPAPGFASPTGAGGDEASGLIDIRALAGSISTAEQDNSVDDLISMGGGGFSPALGAPVLAAQNEGMSNTVKFSIIGGGIAILALVVVVLVVALSGDDDAQTAAQAQIAALQKQIEALSQKGGSAENTAELAKLKEQLDAKKVEAAKASGDAEASAEKSPSDDGKSDKNSGKKAAASSSSSGKKRPSGSSGKSGSSSSGSSSASASSSSKSDDKPTPTRSSKTSELDDLLGPSSGGKPKSSSKPKTGGNSGGGSLGPAPKASLSRSDVQNGMQAVAPAVKRCGQGTGGTITMSITIGKTGRVSSASPTGAFAGTPVGNCAARAVRRAKFPASQKSLNVKYPFKL